MRLDKGNDEAKEMYFAFDFFWQSIFKTFVANWGITGWFLKLCINEIEAEEYS